MAYDGSLLFDTGIDNSGFTSGVQKLSGIATVALGNITSAIVQQISSAAAQIPAQMVEMGSSFEASMSQVAATSGITAATQEYAKLESAAKEMGATTQFSASQAAEALNYLALAGYDADKSIQALPTVLNVAASGGMELAAASDMITDAMSALGLQMDDLNTFADQLAITAQKSNTSVAQLGEAILTVGGTAKSLAGGVVEMNTVLGILADNGIKGAEGGTALRNVILSLSAPTSTAAAALESLKVSAFDANGNMRPLEDTFADINTALSQLTEQDKNAVLSDIFNKVDLKSVNALLGTSAARFDELNGYISNCDNAAAQMAETMNDNLKGDITILQSALEGLGIAAYDKFSVPMRSAVQDVTDTISNLTNNLTSGDLSGKFDKISESFANLTSRAADLVANGVLPAAIDGLSWIVDNGNYIAPMITGAAAAFTTYKIAVGAATVAQNVFNVTCSINPILAVVTAMGLLTAACVTYAEQVDTISKWSKEGTQVYSEQIAQIDKLAKSYNDVCASADEMVAAQDEENSKLEALKNALSEQVDASGKVIGNEELVRDIIAEINEIYPENIELINGQIQGYNELTQSLDDYLSKAKEEVLLKSKKEKWEKAVVIYDETSKQNDELLQNALDADEAYKEALHNYEKYKNGVNNYTKETAEAAKAAGKSVVDYLRQQKEYTQGVWESAWDAYNNNKNLMDSAKADIDSYESALSESSSNSDYASVAEMQARETADKIAAANQTAAEDLLEKQKENTENLKAGWEQVEHDYAIGNIASEQELYARKRDLWNTYGDESLKDHWNYYEDLCKYDKDFAEESAKARKEANEKAAEDAIAARQEEWDSIERLNNLGIMSDEKAAKARQEFIDKYYPELNGDDPKITAENYQYAKQVLDDNTRLAKAALDEQNKVVDDGLSAILKSYQQAYDELDKKRENYRRKLLSIGGDVFSVDVTKDKDGNETTTYTVNNIDEQLKSMREFHNQVKALKERDISDGLLEEMLSLDSDDSMQFAKYLSSMSAEEFAKINDLYKERDQIANDLSADLYADEAKAISDSMTAALAALATSAYDYGATTAQQFSAGFSAAINELGLGVLYNQITAAGATKTYENYVTENNTGSNELTVSVDVSGKSNVYLDGKVVGESVTEYQGKQKKQTGT